MSAPVARVAALRARCELQRNQLGEQVSEIRQRLGSTDRILGTVRDVITRPGIIAGGAALLLTLGKSGWGSSLSRAAVLLTTARRIYVAFKRH